MPIISYKDFHMTMITYHRYFDHYKACFINRNPQTLCELLQPRCLFPIHPQAVEY